MSHVEDPHPDVGKWLENHHRIESDKEGRGEGIHVFAIEHGDVYGKSATKTYSVSFGLGPLTIRIVIVIDLAHKTITVCVYGKLPFLPEFKIVCGSGSFDHGIVLKFSLSVIKGSFRFYIKDKWLWLDYDVTILGHHWKGSIKLIPLPI